MTDIKQLAELNKAANKDWREEEYDYLLAQYLITPDGEIFEYLRLIPENSVSMCAGGYQSIARFYSDDFWHAVKGAYRPLERRKKPEPKDPENYRITRSDLERGCIYDPDGKEVPLGKAQIGDTVHFPREGQNDSEES